MIQLKKMNDCNTKKNPGGGDPKTCETLACHRHKLAYDYTKDKQLLLTSAFWHIRYLLNKGKKIIAVPFQCLHLKNENAFKTHRT